MARILIVTWDGGGNVPPMLGVAAELRGRGHAVRVLGHARQRADVERYDLAFTPYAQALPWSPEDIGTGVRFSRAYLRLFTDPRPGEDVRAVMHEWPADLVLIDCLSLGAIRGAVQSGVPTIVLVHLFYRYLTHGWARSPVGAAAALRGLRPGRLWAAADLLLVASDRELDPAGAGPLPANVRFTGVVQARPVEPAVASAESAVLVSMSTIDYPGQARTLQAVIDAIAPLRVRTVVTTGDGVDPASLTVPANVEVHRYLPHDEVMPAMSLVVGHGGHATTMRALAHGLPLLTLPLHAKVDQPMVGAAVTDAGAGLVVAATSSAEQIRDAIRALLSDGPHRAAAEAIGTRLRGHDGAGAAADEVETVLASRTDRDPAIG